ncbi:transposase [Catellatospora aurea]|uniref:Transposase n=1 Tax=Catellatospora aurea TaxID=1337874 RepID=A0ABW2H5A1_9ACTN
MAAGVSVDPAVWRAEWEGLCSRLAGRFARAEPREQAQAFVRAMLAPVSTRSCWQLAEAAGDDTPDRMQRLLGRAVWDHDGVRDDLRAWVAAQLGGGGIGIIDETADAKKGV